jgi:hypothetical protein
MPNSSSETKLTYLPVATRVGGVAPVGAIGGVARVQHGAEIVASSRFTKLIPKAPTGRERTVGREVAYRAAVQEGHLRLQGSAAVAIAQMHDHTHRLVVAGVCGMNDRLRAVAADDDRAELAVIGAEQKAMYVRHQFGVLEAGCYRVATEVDRELYAERRGGLRGWFGGE